MIVPDAPTAMHADVVAHDAAKSALGVGTLVGNQLPLYEPRGVTFTRTVANAPTAMQTAQPVQLTPKRSAVVPEASLIHAGGPGAGRSVTMVPDGPTA
jgi:hypothetical protein